MHAVGLELEVHGAGSGTTPHVLQQLEPAPPPAATYSWRGTNPFAPLPPPPAHAPHPDDSLIQEDSLRLGADRARDDAMEEEACWQTDAAEAEEEQGYGDPFASGDLSEYELTDNGDMVRRPVAPLDVRRRLRVAQLC